MRNGAGKSTTMRMILGLDQPTAGHATVNGRTYADHLAPLTEVGALLDARAVHPGRTARNHLLALAATTGISRRRVAEVIELTGLGPVVVAAPTSSRARPLLTRSYGLVPTPMRLPRGKGRRGQPGPAGSKSANFHDHEDFSVLCRIKVFAIMKLSLSSSDCRP
jgi:energy-coupling factor transporter ATP-binding protein EcfA2